MRPLKWSGLLGAVVVCSMLPVVAGTARGAPADRETPKSGVQTVDDQWFSLKDADSGEKVGARHLVVTKTDDCLVAVETVSVQQGTGTVAYRAEAAYTLKPEISPASAEVTTYLDGKPFMGGMVDFGEGTITLTGGPVDENEKLQEPLVTTEVPMEEGQTVLLQQGLPEVVADILKPGESMDNVLLVEMPAEVDVLVETDGDCTVRRVSEKEGGSAVIVDSKYLKEPICRWVMDKQGKITGGVWYQTDLIPTTKDEALKPAGKD